MENRLPPTYRISRQPVMALGLNGTELIIVVSAGFAVMAAVALLGAILLGRAHYGLLAGVAAGLVTSVVMKTFITTFKRQKPEGYYVQILRRVRARVAGGRGMVLHAGYWDVLRHGGGR